MTLYAGILNFNRAKEERDTLWRRSTFRRLLIENLRTKTPVLDPPSEEYPRLRCYRGTGERVNLLTAYEPIDRPGCVLLCLELDYVEYDVSIYDESEGCPGAPVQTVRHDLLVPANLLCEPAEKEFAAWARKERMARWEQERDEARKTVHVLTEKYQL